MSDLLKRLAELDARYEELTRQLADPDVIADSNRYREVAKAHAELAEVVEIYREAQRVERELEDARRLAAEEEDGELRALAEEEEIGRAHV